jgi:hypothetical protein
MNFMWKVVDIVLMAAIYGVIIYAGLILTGAVPDLPK